MEPKRLYKSKTNRVICGVCGGIGEYFGIDPTIVRLLCVLLGCTSTGVILYIIGSDHHAGRVLKAASAPWQIPFVRFMNSK